MVVFFAFLGKLEAIGKMEEFQDKIRLWNLSLLYFLFDVDIASVSSRSFMLLCVIEWCLVKMMHICSGQKGGAREFGDCPPLRQCGVTNHILVLHHQTS